MKNIDVNMGGVDFPIDLVYMWVDDGDEEWRSKRDLYRPTEQRSTTADATSAARWRNNDELRYSLRSVEMFAPWVNHIYIVTDNQRPAWLVADHPKVTIVDHRDIIPAEALPTFNSTAIEACLHRIEGLSEHFIFGNDDMLLSAPVSPGDFFHADGRPIVRLMHFSISLCDVRGASRIISNTFPIIRTFLSSVRGMALYASFRGTSHGQFISSMQ